MAKTEINTDLDLKGKATIATVNNSTGSILTYNSSKEISTRTNPEIISDLGLITATNIAAAYYTKTQLQTSGQSSVHFNNIASKPTTLSGYGITDAYTKTEIGDPETNLVATFETSLI